MSRRAGGEAGTTLIEVLIAVVIMGTAIVALLGGFTTAIAGSVFHRGHAHVEAVMRAHTEAIQNSGIPSSCATPTPTPSTTTDADGYNSRITAVQYWNGDNPATFGSCTASSLANGLAKVSILTSSADGKITQSLDLFLRK